MAKFRVGQFVEIRHLRRMGMIIAINVAAQFPICVEYVNKLGKTCLDWFALAFLNVGTGACIATGFTLEHNFN